MGRARKTWTKEEEALLEEIWSKMSIPAIAKRMGRTVSAIKNKAYRLGLSDHLHSSEYITINHLFRALGRNSYSYFLDSFIRKRAMPVKHKKSINMNYKVISIDDFWEWAKEHRTFINFSKMEKNILGKEPEWVKEQRKADNLFAQYKKTPWSKTEDETLLALLSTYKYSYRDLSVRLKRTEGAIKRRIFDLGTMMRPLKEEIKMWTKEEEAILIDMAARGYRPEIIAEHIDRSALSIRAKLERIEKEKLKRVV